ncbi:restriction endonuclease subunit S [Providencia sp. PROV129]|uniref:restriction endonuclease subunit S n=1 Tax=Providencia sp. PROV129 TaxID=2949839 RepID=UPI002349DA46|nr:restriction endonuclease subunit S [Providencia sp. PROV129]
MGSEWKTTKLLEHYELRSGLSKPAKDFGSGYPFLTFKDVFYNYFTPDKLGDLVQSNDKERENCSVKRGDVFLTRTSETMHELGMSSVALKDYENATFNGFCKRLRPTQQSELLPEYVGYYLRSSIFRQAMLAFSTMSTRASLNNEMIGRLEISYPPKMEQVKIATILKNIDDKITLNRQINQTLEQMAQTLFKSWFVDFDPVIDNALDAGFFEQDLAFSDELLRRVEARKAVRESDDFKPLSEEICQLFPDAFEECAEPSLGLGGWIPKGWTISALDKIANFQNGLALQKFRPDSENDEYLPVLKIAQLRQGYCDANEKAKIDIIESCRVYNGDMIFSWSGTLMIDIWTGGDAALNQHLFKVTSKNYPLSFYYHWTNHHLARFQHIAAAKAVTMGHIKKGDLSSSYCVVPTTQVLSYFDSITGSYLEQAKSVRLQCNTLTNLRDTLLPKLISGELSLDDIKIDTPEETLI